MSQKITTRRKDYKRKIRKTYKRKARKTRKTYKRKTRKTHKRKTRKTHKRKIRKTHKRGGAPLDPDRPDPYNDYGRDIRDIYKEMRLIIYSKRIQEQLLRDGMGLYEDSATLFMDGINHDLADELLNTFPSVDELEAVPDYGGYMVDLIFGSLDMEENKQRWEANTPDLEDSIAILHRIRDTVIPAESGEVDAPVVDASVVVASVVVPQVPVGESNGDYKHIRLGIYGRRLQARMDRELSGPPTGGPTLFTNGLNVDLANYLLTEFPSELEVLGLPYRGGLLGRAMELVFRSDDEEENIRIWNVNVPDDEDHEAVLTEIHAEFEEEVRSRQADADRSDDREAFRQQQAAQAASEHERSVRDAYEQDLVNAFEEIAPFEADIPCSEEPEDLAGNAFIGEDGNDLIAYVELEDGSCLSLEDILKTIHGQRWGHKTNASHWDLYTGYPVVLDSIGEEWGEGDPLPDEVELRGMINPIGASAFTDVDMNNIIELVRGIAE